jgi:predicted metal-dependent hydrolase
MNIQTIRSHRKTYQLEVTPYGNLVVRVPLKASEISITAFLSSKQFWIQNKLNYFSEKNLISILPEFKEHTYFYYLGAKYKLFYSSHNKIVIDDYLKYPVKHKNKIKLKLMKWYKKNLTDNITKRISELIKLMNLDSEGIVVENIKITSGLKTLGSCSYINNLTFSWFLVLLPQSVIDYVVIHELSHTLEKNHSPKFWDIVRFYCPKYKEQINIIKEKSLLMYSYRQLFYGK